MPKLFSLQQEAVEMDVESDEDESGPDKKAEEAKKDSMPPPLPPLPPQLDNVLIRKDYNPKAKTVVPVQPQPGVKQMEAFGISPITGERIPAEKLHEHIRFGLLDPRWVEQRDRSIQEKMQQEEVYAVGSAIESSLKQLAERRTDIFGSGDEETAIGKKIGEEERRVPDKVTWDGHTASMEAATRLARQNITIEEQIQQIHKMKGLLPDEAKDKIGPALPSGSISSSVSHTSSNFTISAAPVSTSIPTNISVHSLPKTQPSISNITTNAPSQSHLPPLMAQTSQHHSVMPPMMMGQPGPYMMTPHMMHMGLYGMPMHHPPGLNMPPDMSMNISNTNLNIDSDEPSSKKSRTEENLIAEDEFIRRNPGNVSFKIQVPQSSEKAEWKLNGQVLNLTLPLVDTVSTLKGKIHEQIGMPPGKQKLQYEGIFVKDSNTLAYYNIANGSTFLLGLKERGGRKK